MPFGSVKYTDRMKPWSTTSVTSHPACLRRSRRASSASSSGRLNDRWSNWIARGSGTPAGLANGSILASAYSKKATVHCSPKEKK